MRGILGRQIGTDGAPALAAIRGSQNNLATVVNGVVIERIGGQRWRPVAAILGLFGFCIECVNPRTDGVRPFGSRVVTSHLVAVAGGPDNVGIREIGQGETGFAASEAMFPRQSAA